MASASSGPTYHVQETSPLLPPPTTNGHHPHHEDHDRPSHPPNSYPDRTGFSPTHFLLITYKSSCTASSFVNLLWPVVPAALILQCFPGMHITKFILAYIAVIPSANLVGFAGQEFARKMPKVLGILIECWFGGVVEVVLFGVLILKHGGSGKQGEGEGKEGEREGNLIPIIQAAILGSILTNLLLCLGLCFFVGGLRQAQQSFHGIVSEVGTGLLLVAAFGLLIPSAFYSALKGEANGHGGFTREKLTKDVLQVSRATSIALIVAFGAYIWFQARSQHSIFDEVIEMDEHRDADLEADMEKPKYTMTETMVALAISLTCVTVLLVFLVEGIENVVEVGVPDQFLGLILLPLVEKAAEHLTAVDEAWDGVINVALYHCLAPSIQTALFNAPLVVLIGWALGKPMDLNFEIFMIGLLVLSILVVGNFLRDGESNWLEGALLVIVYGIIAIACWYYPNPDVATSNSVGNSDVIKLSPDAIQELYRVMQKHGIEGLVRL